jgi:hypothetical protein
VNEAPIVRLFVPCEEIVNAVNGQQVTLNRLVYVIRALPGMPYPRIHPRLCLFALLSNGRGQHRFALEVISGVGPSEQTLYISPSFVHDLGTDPLAVHGLPIRLNNLPFPRPGQHEIRLLCNGEPIAHQPLELR